MRFFRTIATCVAFALLVSSANAFEYEMLGQLCSGQAHDSGACGCGDHEEEEACSYGPPACKLRKTLMQWSYGTSFSGGPDLDEPLVTDRPDFTEASSTVGLGVAQLEMGYTYTWDNDLGTAVRGHSFPEALLRYGMLAEWLELRIAWNYLEETTRAGATSTLSRGADDLYLGFKIGLTPQECILPEMALILQTTVPTGSGPFNNNRVLPGFNLIYGWEVTEELSTAGQSQLNKVLDPTTGNPYYEFSQSWTVGRSITEKIGGYAEWYALFPSGADTALPEHYFNGGFTYLVNNDLQLDVRGGKGLNTNAADYFVGTGLVIRFP